MTWKKANIIIDGRKMEIPAPDIISASRSTDIPAFYADWFFHRLETGYSVWNNPFNGKKSYISYQNTRFIVFWSKNPKPLLPYLPILKERGIGCYIQFTLNDYEEYDYLIGMDTENIRNMQRISGGDPDEKIYKLLTFTGSGMDVADPWYTGDFEATYRDVKAGCEGLLNVLREELA